MKKAIIAGASGMVGTLVLKHCLDADQISEVISFSRRNTDNQHPKLNEVVMNDFTGYSSHADLFQNVDMAFFCIGVYTGQVSGDQFRKITVDYAVAFAEALKDNSPKATLCLLSGAGADRTGKSRMSFARYKGQAENRISEMGLDFYAFRPGYIYPVTPRKEPSPVYRLMRMLYPLIKLLGANSSVKSTDLARAMFNVALRGAKAEILENRGILEYK